MRGVRDSRAPLLALAAGLFLLWSGVPEAASQTPRSPRAAPAATATYDTSHFRGLEWRNIGPQRGGRSIAVAGTSTRPNEYYFGATGGGVWKSTDGGQTWRPVGDGQFRSSSVGALAQCEANPDIVYAGMGEVQLRGNIIAGDGVYRSSDGGKTWTHLGLASSTGQQSIGRVRVHPQDCELVYVAALGDPFGPNEERGVYRSRDGGRNWEKVLYRNERAGAADLVLDPTNPQVIYAGLWEVYRQPWKLSSGGPGSGLFKSTDGGTTWTELTRNPGLPQGIIGKVGVSPSGADPNTVYAIIEAEDGGVFRSDDAGATWERVSDDRNLRQRAFYYTRLNADPQDRETVYVLNVQFWRSTDGGKTWKDISTPHGDNHDLWIDPRNNQRMIEANDGGANVSLNAGETWTEQFYPTAQMYTLATTSHYPYHVCGGQQDNSTVCVPSDGDGTKWWYAAGGGESGWVTPHPRNTNIFYAGSYGGYLSRYDQSNGQTRSINVWPENPMGHSAGEIRERFQWTFPIVISPHDPKVLYVASQHLWRSTNEGQSWERISPDLTYADPETLGPSGGPITRDQTGVEYYATLFSVAPSRREPNTIWVGSDDGRVHITRDGGASWQEITPPDLPKFSRIHFIDASPHAAGKAYVAAVRYRLQDVAPYVYRTEDYGRTWTKITNGIRQGDFVRGVREDLVRQGLVFAGTENGVYVSFDDGANWQPLQLNLPVSPIHALEVRDNDVVIATHGRSYYVLDDISPLRQLSPEVTRSRIHLFAPATAVRSLARLTGGDGRYLYNRSRTSGVAITYYLRAPARNVSLEILDAQGQVIRKLEGVVQQRVPAAETPAATDTVLEPPLRADQIRTRAGMNRFVWNLRYPGAQGFPGMIMWAAGTQGPTAPPGRYQVRLTVDGRSQTQPFELIKDPRLSDVTQADLEEQFRLAMRIRDKTEEANAAVRLIRGVRNQIDERMEAAGDGPISSAGEALKTTLSEIEQEIYQVRNQSRQDPLNFPIKLNNKIAALMGVVESADARPTQQAYAVFEELSRQLDTQLARLNQALDTDLAQFNQLLRGRRLAAVSRTPIPAEAERGSGS